MSVAASGGDRRRPDRTGGYGGRGPPAPPPPPNEDNNDMDDMDVDGIGGDDQNEDYLFTDQCPDIAQYFVGVGKAGAHCIASVKGGYGYYISDRRNAEKNP